MLNDKHLRGIASALLAALLWPAQAGNTPASSPCQLTSETQRNADGSQVRVTQRICPGQPCALQSILYATSPGQAFIPLAHAWRLNDGSPTPLLNIDDWDHDNNHEISLTGPVGPGANALVLLLRVDKHGPRLAPVFEGFGYVPRKLGPYLVQESHDSAVADLVHHYRILAQGRQVASGPEFSILVPHETDKNETGLQASCHFYPVHGEPDDDATVHVNIPRKNHNLSAYCERIGRARHLLPRRLPMNSAVFPLEPKSTPPNVDLLDLTQDDWLAPESRKSCARAFPM